MYHCQLFWDGLPPPTEVKLNDEGVDWLNTMVEPASLAKFRVMAACAKPPHKVRPVQPTARNDRFMLLVAFIFSLVLMMVSILLWAAQHPAGRLPMAHLSQDS